MIAVLLLISMVYTLGFFLGGRGGGVEVKEGRETPLEISFHISSLHDWPVPLLTIALSLIPMNVMFSQVSIAILSKCLVSAFRTRHLP